MEHCHYKEKELEKNNSIGSNMEKTNIITLSDENKYMIINKATINSTNYYYLIDIHNSKNIKFCQERQEADKIILKEISDPELIKDLIKRFFTQDKEK